MPLCEKHHGRGMYRGNESCGIAVHARKNPHARNIMTCEQFAGLAKGHGLEMVSQEKLRWSEGKWAINDCLSSFRRPRRRDGHAATTSHQAAGA